MAMSQVVNHSGAFERLLNLREAADLLGVHPDTLKRRARAGEVPAFRYDKCWRFRASELDAWVRSKLVSGPNPTTPR